MIDEKTTKNDVSIEAKIFLNVRSNPVLNYLDQTFEIPSGFKWHRCTHSHIRFYKEWAGKRKGEINEIFLNQEGYVDYDLFCIFAGANAGFTQYVLATKDAYGNTYVATGPKLMSLYWVRREDIEKILNYIKTFKVSSLRLVTERANLPGGEYRSLRYGWLSEPNTNDEENDDDEVQPLTSMNGFHTGLIYLPYYGVASDSVIFIRKDKPEHSGWEKLIQALENMEDNEVIHYYSYLPYNGKLVNIKKIGDFYKAWSDYQAEPEVFPKLSICDIFGSIAEGHVVDNNFIPLLREYFIKNSKAGLESSFCKDDYYFGLLNSAGISLAIEVAHENGDAEIENKLQSWLSAGMTDEDSRKVCYNSTIDSCYNHTYYWRGKTVAYEKYGVNSPRHKVICFASDNEK
jgi:hypothetical protein